MNRKHTLNKFSIFTNRNKYKLSPPKAEILEIPLAKNIFAFCTHGAKTDVFLRLLGSGNINNITRYSNQRFETGAQIL